MVDDTTRCSDNVQQPVRQYATVLVVPVVREILFTGPVSQADGWASIRVHARLVGCSHLLRVRKYSIDDLNISELD